MMERKKILWLVSWYPNKYDAFDGDFIQRHAKAAALYNDIHVLFVKQHEQQPGIEKIWRGDDGLTEQIIYTPKRKGLKNKFTNYRQWREQYRSQVKLAIERYQPTCIHVHVPWKTGLIALWAKHHFKIPYLVTEHWGIYNTVVDDNIFTRSFFTRYLLRRIFREAAAFISVSNYLGEGLNKLLLKKNYTIIPNVVDTSMFFYEREKHPRFTFLHVSNMVPLKNVEGILRAFYTFLQTGADAQLILIGNRDNFYVQDAENIGIPNTSVFFKGEISYADVAKEMRRSHVFILNSTIENSPCVIGEALCCGLPVIATNVGGIPELLDEVNSILILQNNTDALVKAMLEVYQNDAVFNRKKIASEAAGKFSTESVGKQFQALYAQL